MTGAPAKAHMEKKTNWTNFDLEGSTFISPEVKSNKPHSVTSAPRSLNSLLSDLEKMGHVKAKLRLHTVERQTPRAKCPKQLLLSWLFIGSAAIDDGG